jgi:hypothetical protein
MINFFLHGFYRVVPEGIVRTNGMGSASAAVAATAIHTPAQGDADLQQYDDAIPRFVR